MARVRLTVRLDERRHVHERLNRFVLGRVHEQTEGRSLRANHRLVEDNAGLAAEIAAACYAE